MSKRIFQHALFWLSFILLYAITKFLFAAPSAMALPPVERFLRIFLGEVVLFPWKIIPFYFLFYLLVPNYFKKRKYTKFILSFVAIIIICLFGHRSLVSSVTYLVYGESTDFNVYSLKRMLYTLLDILPAVGLAASVKLLIGSIATQEKEQALQKEKLESELNFLKAQTNPHFLFNTLNNLYGLARKNDTNTAPSILKLSNIMRYILYECSAPRIPIKNEIKIIEDYIQLEQLRYDERLNIDFNKNIDNEDAEIAPLILLPFVENAFKHGVSESRFNTFIHLDLELQNGQLKMQIQNSKDEDDTPINSNGIGLRNVRRQLDLVYGQNYSLTISPEKETYTIELKIQLNHYEQ
jgi:sensor histidine kinase YesM